MALLRLLWYLSQATMICFMKLDLLCAIKRGKRIKYLDEAYTHMHRYTQRLRKEMEGKKEEKYKCDYSL